MKKIIVSIFISTLISCSNYGLLKHTTALPKKLKEASGIENIKATNLLWMHNDSGNESTLYGVNENGGIEKTIIINANNKDWEDITSDDFGNIYIADFGNNANKRKDLVILKVKSSELLDNTIINPQKIYFNYPEQKKFPPKKKNKFFDAESLIYLNGYLYIFTKSRVKNMYGKTNLYKIPASEGNHTAEFLGTFNNCDNNGCWITAAAISDDHKKVALLTHHEVLIFTNFSEDNFFDGLLTRFNFNHSSQKEGIDFKNNNTLYITDERAHNNGGNLYTFSIN